MAAIFISHSSSDKPLVEALVGLLERGIGIPHNEIFCSSLKGQGVPAGMDFARLIRKRLKDSKVVIALISDNFYASAFSMCELGGVWLAAKKFVPLLAPSLTFGSSLKAVLTGVQALKVGEAEDLDDLRDAVTALAESPVATARWSKQRDLFLEALPGVVAQIKTIGPVPLDKHRTVRKKLKKQKKRVAELEVEVERLKTLNAELEALKDVKEVARVVRKHMPERERFEELTDAAETALGQLPGVVREVLYLDHCGEEMSARDADFDSLRDARQRGWLSEDDGLVSAKYENPKVKKASKAVDDLTDWLRSTTEGFQRWYEGEYDDEQPNTKHRQFWEDHLKLPRRR